MVWGVLVPVLPGHELEVAQVGSSWGHPSWVHGVEGLQSGVLLGGQWPGSSLIGQTGQEVMVQVLQGGCQLGWCGQGWRGAVSGVPGLALVQGCANGAARDRGRWMG